MILMPPSAWVLQLGPLTWVLMRTSSGHHFYGLLYWVVLRCSRDISAG